MGKSVCILLACFPGLYYAVPRRPEIADVLQRHDHAFTSAVGAIVECAAPHLLDALFVPPSRKAPKDGRNARDTTLVDASLSMVGHVLHAIQLPFQEADRGVDNVLECVVRHIANAQHGEASKILRGLNVSTDPWCGVRLVCVRVRLSLFSFAK